MQLVLNCERYSHFYYLNICWARALLLKWTIQILSEIENTIMYYHLKENTRFLGKRKSKNFQTYFCLFWGFILNIIYLSHTLDTFCDTYAMIKTKYFELCLFHSFWKSFVETRKLHYLWVSLTVKPVSLLSTSSTAEKFRWIFVGIDVSLWILSIYFEIRFATILQLNELNLFEM